jgi:hypothetical protein
MVGFALLGKAAPVISMDALSSVWFPRLEAAVLFVQCKVFVRCGNIT